MDQLPQMNPYWSETAVTILTRLHSQPDGLSSAAAAERLVQSGRNIVQQHRQRQAIHLLLDRFRNPLIWILFFAAVVAMVVQEWANAIIVLAIVTLSTGLSFIQEYQASQAVEKLRQQVAVKAKVWRDGQLTEIALEEVVPGDVVVLSAGSLIPGDGLLLQTKDCYVTQALLTGEMFPVEKRVGMVAANATLAERSNCVFMGSSVRSGTAVALIIHTGSETIYGQIATRLSLAPPETELDRGLRVYGALLMRVMLVVVIIVLAINMLLARPPVDTLLFAVALAVGLSPELLPAILAITLARGAQNMAKQGVIVHRLNAIENLGSMDVLCTDKTGTLTKGVARLNAALDGQGQASAELLRLAYLNASFQAGLANPLDAAIIACAEAEGLNQVGYQKLDEIPYDFIRKRLGLVVTGPEGLPFLVVKGALQNVLEVCDSLLWDGEMVPLDATKQNTLHEQLAQWSEQGYRVLGLAQKRLPLQASYGRGDEVGLLFMGFLLFFDPPEPGVRETLANLRQLGVQIKIVTGDNQLVARHVMKVVGLENGRILTGSDLQQMSEEALWQAAPTVTLFAETDPQQKERIIRALQKNGHVVGYLGDGINDAPALHAADVGISVDNAADVAKETADFVILKHDLSLVLQGVEMGRYTFANTLKYIFVTTSANFGNMISMAVASLALPFLPLLAKQVLLNNFLSDIPAMGIAGDHVDSEWENTPHRWDIRMIRNFMIAFGLVSTLFDLITFATLLYFWGDTPDLFRTGWFTESLLTELCILFVIRTYKPFYASRPGRVLLVSALAVGVLTLLFPWLPIASLFELVVLPLPVVVTMLGITGLYLVISEVTKGLFYQRLRL